MATSEILTHVSVSRFCCLHLLPLSPQANPNKLKAFLFIRCTTVGQRVETALITSHLRSDDIVCQWWDLVFVSWRNGKHYSYFVAAGSLSVHFIPDQTCSFSSMGTNVVIKTSFLLLANGNKESCLRSAQTRLSRGRQSRFGCIRLHVFFPPSVTDLSVVTWISFIFTDRRW